MYYLYIPGLGDKYDFLRRWAVWLWNIRRGVTAKVVPMRWSSSESYIDKRSRLVSAIKSISTDKQIVLVGESAGGSMAIAMFAKNPDSIHAVVTIAGKNHTKENVSEIIYRKHPAFEASLEASDKALGAMKRHDRARIYTIYSERDDVVAPKNSLISGSSAHRLNTPGHAATILILIFFRFSLITQLASKK